MLLISLLIAVLLRQYWESSNPLHYDGWINTLHQGLTQLLQKISIAQPVTIFTVAISLVTGSCLIISYLLEKEATFIYILFSIGILLYCFGRGDFNQAITSFIVAEAKQDWPEALKAAAVQSDNPTIAPHSWRALNTQFLANISYTGFERFFAVVFWFALLGPAGALAYRFSYLWCAQVPSSKVTRWLWVIEWPAVRVLGLTYALTGNFSGCINVWRTTALCQQRTSKVVLLGYLIGALAVDDQLEQSQEVTRRELEALQQLLTRTLWCWLGIFGFLFLS